MVNAAESDAAPTKGSPHKRIVGENVHCPDMVFPFSQRDAEALQSTEIGLRMPRKVMCYFCIDGMVASGDTSSISKNCSNGVAPERNQQLEQVSIKDR